MVANGPLESGSRAPVSEANPGERPWAELDAIGRRKVVDSYRRAGRRSVPWVSGPRNGLRCGGRRNQPHQIRRLVIRFDGVSRLISLTGVTV
jgi:hypothetical protein